MVMLPLAAESGVREGKRGWEEKFEGPPSEKMIKNQGEMKQLWCDSSVRGDGT